MRYQYVVTLKRESQWTTAMLSILLCLLSAVFFLYAGITSLLAHAPNTNLTWFELSLAAILLTGLAVNFISLQKGPVRYRFLLLVAGLGWFITILSPWLPILFVVLAFLEYQTRRPLEIGFDADRVVINSLIRRRYAWTDLSNVVLRDGLLTLDFKTNKLLQKEVMEDDDDDDADEDEFNNYCRLRLRAAESNH